LSAAQLHKVYHVALGFEDSFLITWLDKKGQDRIDSHGLPPELLEFIYARNVQNAYVREISRIRCSLGPYNESFFAHDGSAYRWMNLPATLLSALQARIKDGNWIDSPRLVSLGANNNFVLITKKHAAFWDLEHYKTIANLLQYSTTQERGISEIHSVILHAHRFGSFVTQSRNGTLIHENLPPHSLPGIQAMCAPMLQDSKALEQRLLARRDSATRDIKDTMSKRPSDPIPTRPSNLQQRAQLRRDWGEHKSHFAAQTKGAKISLSLSVSISGIAKLMR
jgi:hypothetical protein